MRDFRNSDRPRKEIHYRHRAAASRRKNSLAASWRNMILAFADPPPLTGRRGSRSHSRRTAVDPLHALPGISAFFPPAPESASPNACLRIFRRNNTGTGIFFSSGCKKRRTDFSQESPRYQRGNFAERFPLRKKTGEDKACVLDYTLRVDLQAIIPS